jgi:glycerate dehydrogenase
MKNHKIVVLDAKTIGDNSVFQMFSDLGNLTVFETTFAHERLEHILDATIIITNKVLIDKDIMDSCPNLKLVCLTATGMNNVDLPYAAQKGIIVKNVAGYSTESVAQHTFAMLLSLLHHTTYYSQFVSSKEYSNQSLFTHIGPGYWELKGKTWGIIGLGTIGRRVAQIATAFGCNIIYYSTSGKNSTQDYPQKSLSELLAESDVVSIHAPLNEQTLGLIGITELSLMKSSAYIVNVGRGGIINEIDLADSLKCNKIAGACIDVMKHEPLEINSSLLDESIQSKLLITPHVAWISNEALSTLIAKVYKNVQDFLEHN